MRRPILGPVLTAPFSGAVDPVSAVAQAVSSVSDMLPKIGIGTKSRQKEIQVSSDASMSLINAQTESTLAIEKAKSKEIEKMIFIAIVGIFLIAATIVAARR